MLQGGVFINYCGEDSYSYGALLYAELSRCFGPALVFLDSESIPGGADFVDQLLDQVRHARVVLAVIGSRWLTASGPKGRRIDDPADWIRRELTEAFAAGVRVIPVLTDDADMPTVADLPEELATLARCQYRRLRYRDASLDLARLTAELVDLDSHLAAAAAARAPQPQGWQLPSQVLSVDPRHSPGWPLPDQIPAVAGYFAGRKNELARLMSVGNVHGLGPMVLAVNGMPGVGKTELILRAARRLIDDGRFPDGATFVDLRGFSGNEQLDAAAALDALLHSLGVTGAGIPVEIGARAALYRTVVARRQMLIVLDNALDEAQVRPLLPGTGDSLVLITSRRRLAGLDFADHITLDVLSVPEAVRLFRAMVSTQDLVDEHTVEGIVRLCGQLPLAVRIAGARLRTTRALAADRLLALLRTEQDRLSVLDDGERSVKAALAMSFRHLPVDQQRTFVAVGRHPGLEFEPGAISALLDTGQQHALRMLEALEQVSLVDQRSASRFTVHDLARAYAVAIDERSAAQRQAALGRLYDHYARGACRAMDLLYPYETPYRPHTSRQTDTESVCDESGHGDQSLAEADLIDGVTARSWLDAEMDNLIAAAHHAANQGRPDHTIQQSATLHRHLRTLGKYRDAQTLHRHALELARAAGSPEGELEALIALGSVFRFVGQYASATKYLEQATEKARDIGSVVGEVRAATELGQVFYAQGAHSHAVKSFYRALDLAHSSRDCLGEAAALAGLGRVHFLQGRLTSAATCFEQTLEVAQQLHYPPGELDAMIGLAYVSCAQGQYGSAAACFERTLLLARSFGDLTGQLDALVGLGNTHRLQRQYDAAARYYDRVLQISRAIGDRHAELSALSGLATSRRLQGQNGLAKGYFEQLLNLSCALGGRNYQLDAHLGLGRIYQALGNPLRALDANLQALSLADELGQLPDQVRALDGVAHARRTLGQREQAGELWRRALQILADLGIAATEDVTALDIQASLDASLLPSNYAGLEEPDSAGPSTTA
jgi:tetratricopeptide (TPR) repeat protein